MTAVSLRWLGRGVRRHRAMPPLSVVVAAGRGLVVEIEHGEAGLRPRRAAPFSFAKEDLGTLQSALRQVLAAGGWRGRQVAFGLSGDWIRQGVVEVPALPKAKLDPVLAHEAAALAGVTDDAAPITGYTWGYQCYPSATRTRHVLLAVADRQLIAAVTAAAANAGFTPVRATTLDLAGLRRLMQHDAMVGGGMVAQVAVDAEETSFCVFEGERLVFHRILLRGFRSRESESGDLGPEERLALQRLSQELQRTALYVKRETRQAIDLLVIGGIPRAAAAARQVLAEHLRLPVAWESLPPDGLQAEDASEVLYLAALGVALPGGCPESLDLLPRRSFDERHPSVGWLAVAAGVLLWAGAAMWAAPRLATAGDRTDAVAAEVAALMVRAQPAVHTVDARYQRLQGEREEIAHYLQALERGHRGLTPTAAMAVLGDGLPRDVVLLDGLLEMDRDGWRCALRGAVVAGDRGAAARAYEGLLGHLEGSHYVHVKMANRERIPPTSSHSGQVALVRDSRGGSLHPFELTCRLVVPEGG